MNFLLKMQDRDLILYPLPHIQCSQPHPFPVGLKSCFQLGCAEFRIVPAKLFYVIHCFWQGDALGFRQEHHKSTADGCQGTCGTGKRRYGPQMAQPPALPPAPSGSRCAPHPNSSTPCSSAPLRTLPSSPAILSRSCSSSVSSDPWQSHCPLHCPPSLPSSRCVTRQGWSPRLPRAALGALGLLAVGVHPLSPAALPHWWHLEMYSNLSSLQTLLSTSHGPLATILLSVLEPKSLKHHPFLLSVKIAQSCPILCDPIDYPACGIL